MKKLMIILFILLLSCTQIAAAKSSQTDSHIGQTSLTEKQKLEDLESLCNLLESRQKHLFQVVPKETFLQTKEAITKAIPNLDDVGFYYELQRLVALSRDAHTYLENDPIYSNIQEQFLPIEFKELDGKWYLITSYDQAYKEYLTYELIEINERSIKSILTLAKPYISYENNIRLERNFTEMLTHADLLKHLGIVNNLNDITLTLRDGNGSIKKVTMNTCSWYEMQQAKRFSAYKTPETKQNAEKLYEYFSLNEDTFMLRYNAAKEDTRYPIGEFSKDLKKELEKHTYTKVIVDLRDNKGGNYTLFPPVIQMLTDLKEKQHFKLYALISEDTFSSGVIHAAQLQHDAGAILIGAPTSGNVYFYGNTDNAVELPHSKLAIIYSTEYAKDVPGYKADALYPDIEITHTINDYVSGIDKDVELILGRAELNISRMMKELAPNTQSIIIDNVAIKYYDDASPYLHDIVTNDTDSTLVGFKMAMLTFNKEGKPLTQYWLGPDSKKTYLHVYEMKRMNLLSGQTWSVDGGWSLYDDNGNSKTEAAYALYCNKEVTFANGEIWKNPAYDAWVKTYAGKQVDVKTLQNYYPYVQHLK